jgi:hypothetical protein
MKRPYRSISWCRAAIIVWSCAWMLAVPLFHVHPDTDHRHGEAGHVHGGTVHTVLSRDLDCEFSNAQAIRGSGHTAHGNESVSAPQSHRWNEHPEFGISLLTDPTDRKSLKPCSMQVLVIASAVVSDRKPHRSVHQSTIPLRPSSLFSQDLKSRAPPLFLV